MQLSRNHHLAYCTNIHRGEAWAETWDALKKYTLAVRDRVCPSGEPYAIGLRLSARAARELSEPTALLEFQRWLDRERCYVFTINGFPYGEFHGSRVKERVYLPDWTTPERLDYTRQLFDLMARLARVGVGGSVSTSPGSFKPFIRDPLQEQAMIENLLRCADHIARLSEETGLDLHLGLEPEPLGYFETTGETVAFFERLFAASPETERVREHLGVNYDTCHLAIEFEEPGQALGRLRDAGIRISKLHLSCALRTRPHVASRRALAKFIDDVYLHQVIARDSLGRLTRHQDLDMALAAAEDGAPPDEEWRIHFHVPLHTPDGEIFQTTSDHLLGALDVLTEEPKLCSHLEIETYTWEVLPEELRSASVVDQLAAEYMWCLKALAERGLAGERRGE
jgi:hypothetical protein